MPKKRVHKKCPHGRSRKENCKICNAKGFCDHGKLRRLCKTCGGASICEHGRLRTTCKECKGGSICLHNTQRAECKICKPEAFCEHGRLFRYCMECGGSSLCQHGRKKSMCVECGGSATCSHGKLRAACQQCGGWVLCEHGRWRTSCGQCGFAKCPHGRPKKNCPDCGGGAVCKHHTTSGCGTVGNPKYDKYCTHCFANVFPNDPRTAEIRFKSKEIQWVNAILQSDAACGCDWTWDKPLYVTYDGGCCNSKRRIDLWALVGNVVVAIEVDEYQHKRCEPDYEENRYNDLIMDFTGRFVFLRINPDSYTSGGNRLNPSFADRFQQVEAQLEVILSSTDDVQDLVTVHHMFYDET